MQQEHDDEKENASKVQEENARMSKHLERQVDVESFKRELEFLEKTTKEFLEQRKDSVVHGEYRSSQASMAVT